MKKTLFQVKRIREKRIHYILKERGVKRFAFYDIEKTDLITPPIVFTTGNVLKALDHLYNDPLHDFKYLLDCIRNHRYVQLDMFGGQETRYFGLVDLLKSINLPDSLYLIDWNDKDDLIILDGYEQWTKWRKLKNPEAVI